MVDIPDWEQHRETIRRLADLVEAQLPLLTTDENHPLARQLAAAYLARCRRLVVAMDLLYEAGMRDVVGGVLRICFEAWLTGLWVLFTGRDAVARLNREYISRMNQLIREANLGEPLQDEVDDVPNPPNVADMASEVGRLLVEAGDNAGDTLRWSYDLVYRYQSAYGIHRGFASVRDHLDVHGIIWSVRPIRQDPSDGAGELLWGAVLLGVLARRVFVEFGVGVDDLDSLIVPIQQLAEELNEQVVTKGSSSSTTTGGQGSPQS